MANDLVKSRLGYTYCLKDALRHNPTIINAGDDICAIALDRIEALQAENVRLQDAIERGAQIVEEGYTCRRCGCIFTSAEGHPDNDCIHPTWDAATDERKAEAIRAALQQDNPEPPEA